MSFSPNKTNPLILTSNDIQIQPYWIVVLQFIIRMGILILFNYCSFKVPLPPLTLHAYKKYITKVNQQNQKNNSRTMKIHIRYQKSLEFNIIDTFFSIWVLGHAIWYCIIQSLDGCQSTIWNCYNLFGYRLYNYVFVSYSSVFINSTVKFIALRGDGYFSDVPRTLYRQSFSNFTWYSRYFHLVFTTITLIFVGVLLFPYIFTNILPMMIIYFWFFIFFLTATFFFIEIPLIISHFFYNIIWKGDLNIVEFFNGFHEIEMPYLIREDVVVYVKPIILATLYNYSQYFYYGNNYIELIAIEYDLRDTKIYFDTLRKSTDTVLHTILNFL